jgi:hypothetical protein
MDADTLIENYLSAFERTVTGHEIYASFFYEDLGLESAEDVESDDETARTFLLEATLRRILELEIFFPDQMDPPSSAVHALDEIRLLSERFGIKAIEMTEEDFEDMGDYESQHGWLDELVAALVATYPKRVLSPNLLETAGEILRTYPDRESWR